jgi:hypothetical protein
MIVDKKKYTTGWGVIKEITLLDRYFKARWVMHQFKLETDLGQPTVEIIRLLKLNPARFRMCCTEEDSMPSCRREWISFFDKVTKVAFSIKRAEIYNTNDYLRRLCWIRNSHHCEEHPWFTETELDALCTTVKDLIKQSGQESAQKEWERQQDLLEKGRQKMMAVYNLEE